MKTYLDCFPCFLDQALRAGRIVTKDEKKLKRILDEVGKMLSQIPLESTPPESGRLIYQKVSEITGIPDPCKDIKEKSTKEALALYPLLKDQTNTANDRLLTAIRIAIAGNVIDFGVNNEFHIEETIDETLGKDFAIFDYNQFKAHLNDSDEILYIGDNAGECVFDRVLIEEMKKPVTYVVRGAPIINDATYEDAIQAGIDKVATIISSGTDAPGTIIERCHADFRKVYDHSTFIISKGQGNYETLSNEKRPIFFLLKVKCRVIADHIGVDQGDIILKGIRI
jgi:uncharacterized protein with ATP-grasp and redox domains